MQNSKTQETLTGLFVACGIAALFFMAMQISNLGSFSSEKVYNISANFENAGGLKVKSPVTIAGFRVGRVSSISINKDFVAVVKMNIASQYKLPDDTVASIYTAGLLGEQYISLDPGGEEEFLEENGVIDITSSAVILEQLIGKFFTDKESQ
ncbi:MAG: outer membrane lipid asymmetry maintenance protein MlaD [Methylococcales symbiont of Hymedesmia sp. n. MRB-2018]|nr:MAG: outer membrane lipid asymmetry maintenance protein MlaD [Methylococcales symbiont of Hymedesmia sp. n. MRB-2018]KAF3984625.1 MAG: outer membrane lipid asymmetry maintenance protein MlaD [Methylococcales symbiont of Hymedesmia sp. n. MRB-2018]